MALNVAINAVKAAGLDFPAGAGHSLSPNVLAVSNTSDTSSSSGTSNATSTPTVNLFFDAVTSGFGYAASVVSVDCSNTIYAVVCTSAPDDIAEYATACGTDAGVRCSFFILFFLLPLRIQRTNYTVPWYWERHHANVEFCSDYHGDRGAQRVHRSKHRRYEHAGRRGDGRNQRVLCPDRHDGGELHGHHLGQRTGNLDGDFNLGGSLRLLVLSV